MTILSELEKVRENTFWLIILDLIFLISPAILIIFHFQRDIFLTLDFFKIVLLSIAYVGPVIFWNALICGIPINPSSKDELSLFSLISASILCSNSVLYFLFFVSYIFGTSFRMFWGSVAITELIFTIIIFMRIMKKESQQIK